MLLSASSKRTSVPSSANGKNSEMTPVEALMDTIRSLCFQKRVRINEFFIDFDKLRSGFVSLQQFRRCLSMFGMELRDEDFDHLVAVYLDPKLNKVNYAKFSNDVDQVFTLKNMEKNPKIEALKAEALLQSQKSIPELTEDLNTLYEKLRWESKTQGHIIKNYFKDFDPLNHGTVTRSQFLQCLPFRNLNGDELHMILDRYTDEKMQVNYLRFHEEVENDTYLEHIEQPTFQREPISYEENVEEIEKEIKKALIKHRIKLDETFRDYDRLRTGFITKPQFIAALGSVKLHKMALNADQLEAVAEKYRVEDKHSETRVSYQEFLNNMNSVFNDKGLEKFPTKKFVNQNQILTHKRKSLSEEKEHQCSLLLDKIRDTVKTKRILLKPIFQDFDKTKKGTYATDHVTFSRFERVLHMVGIHLTSEEYAVLEEKYDDLGKGLDVNYKMFLEDVDEILEGSNIPYKNLDISSKGLSTTQLENTQKSFQDIMEDISFKALVHRVRLEEFMRDMDPLRSFEITQKQFRSALSMGGIQLTDSEFNLLCAEFMSPTKKDYVLYRSFCDQVDSVITEKNLEKQPTRDLTSTKVFAEASLTKRGPQKIAISSFTKTEDVELLLSKLHDAVQTRGIALKLTFEDFDKFKRGKITKSQFTQGLDKLFKFLSEEDFKLLQEAYFEPLSGYVNYFKFIEDVDKNERVDGLTKSVYAQELEAEMSKNFVSPKNSKELPLEISNLMNRVKSVVVKNRIRLKEFFTDFDKLRHGYVTRAKFRTALNMAKLELKEQEIQILEEYFKLDSYQNCISYTALCDELDRAFTISNLEKCPKSKIEKFEPRHSYPLKAAIPEISNDVDENELQYILTKVAMKAAVMQQLLSHYFQDYDRLRKQRVTKSQFASIIDFLKFNLTGKQYDILQRKYEDERGDVDYYTFCKDVDKIVSTL
ncbi:hypothetical protein C9374_003441 [Naegleria lovaniensis]|uniref:EF-hand domain-containing protein n=1 Tax=Naegleria lovaniensis TaxID=51637 RepID=A0AA88GTQ5_NAELO|nr:uncharacterized protein C9374_003441 [Naegleria lovaniensis]KAG2385626.1 hypothetical protein C9374_003441 [Naegleria lovaniensis]